jgi:hypothetical protein
MHNWWGRMGMQPQARRTCLDEDPQLDDEEPPELVPGADEEEESDDEQRTRMMRKTTGLVLGAVLGSLQGFDHPPVIP